MRAQGCHHLLHAGASLDSHALSQRVHVEDLVHLSEGDHALTAEPKAVGGDGTPHGAKALALCMGCCYDGLQLLRWQIGCKCLMADSCVGCEWEMVCEESSRVVGGNCEPLFFGIEIAVQEA